MPFGAALSPGRYKRVALGVTSLGTMVAVLNASTLIIALPTIMVKLNTSLFGVMWVLISYTLVLTILAPAWGRLADIQGRKKLYVFGLVVFTIGSLLCGIAENVTQLVLFRVIQAVGGSLLVANGAIIVTDAFDRGELGRAMGILSMIIAAAFVVGPILGGILTTASWRLNFFFSVPVGAFAAWWAHEKLCDNADLPEGQTFDVEGMLLFGLSFLTTVVYFTAGFMVGLTSLPMLTDLAVAILGWVLFLRREKKVASPLIDIDLFRIRAFTAGQVSNFLNSLARGAVMILLILFFQGPRGHDPLIASLLIAPLAVGLSITGPLGGFLADRYGTRLIGTLGLAISLVGLIGLAVIHYNTPYPYIAVWMFVNGFGSGLFQPPNTSSIMAAVPVDRRGVASSMRAFLINAGMVLSMGFSFPIVIGSMTMTDMMSMFIKGGATMPVAMQEAFTGGVTKAFIVSALITIPAIIVSALRGGMADDMSKAGAA